MPNICLAACILQLGWGQVNESPRAADWDGPQKQEVTDTATRRTGACGWSVLTEFKSVLKVLYYGEYKDVYDMTLVSRTL